MDTKDNKIIQIVGLFFGIIFLWMSFETHDPFGLFLGAISFYVVGCTIGYESAKKGE